MTLPEILKDNPFSEAVVVQWQNDLDQFNKGIKTVSDLCFLLDDDRDKLENDPNLHLELLPHPFMGNPNAPIWYLPMNPSYSPIDQYDNLGICPGCGRRLALEASHKGIPSPFCPLSEWFDRGRNRMECLVERQEKFLNQLQLPNNPSFAFLEKDFNTLGDCPDCPDNGGYRWWNRRLFGTRDSKAEFLFANTLRDAASVAEKLFVLEPFPYHSKTFKSRYFKSSIYFDFWVRLVKWGIDNEKMFIVRSTNKTFNKLIEKERIEFNNNNRVGLKGQNAALSIKNLDGDRNVIEILKEIVRN